MVAVDIKLREFERIDETVYEYTHESGLKAFLIQKKGYSKKFAAFATRFGSVNNKFVIPGETSVTNVPDGTAHFLEHKLFEQKDGSVMDKFSKLGSNPNAYTSFAQTVYLFSCTDGFSENFRLLLDFVQNPYITDESVEKEKGIIGQEIMMYRDNPGWRSFFNLLEAFYFENPVKIDIAGSIESIGQINRETLYKCFNTFYHPSNMVLCIVGDVNHEDTFRQIEERIVKTDRMPEIKTVFPQEPESVKQHYIEQSLSVSMPMFQMGFKDVDWERKGIESLKREIAVKMLLEALMGRSSRLYDELYGKGLINSTFEYDYTIEESFAFSTFGGESSNPEEVRDRLISEIESCKKSGIDRSTFERIKKVMYGRFIRQLNSVERISHTFLSVYFRDINMFEYPDVCDRITYDYVWDLFNRHFNPDRLCLSVIKPVK